MSEKEEKNEENDDIEAEIMADLEDLDNELDDAIHEEDTNELSDSDDEPSEPSDQEEEIEEDGIKSNDQEINEPESDIPAEEGESEDLIEDLDEVGESEEESEQESPISSDELKSDAEDEQSKKKNIVEGALFVAGRPISVEELNIKTEIKKRELEEILNELAMDYLMRSTALEIVQIQDKYSLQIKPEYTPNVKKFASGGLIPDKHLKTLTIIALKQPILKSTLVKIRGSGAYDHVKFLLDRGFIETYKKGRSHEIITTDQFADTFGLSRDIQTLKKQMVTQLGINDSKKDN
ncbi:Segregation and condensation protein B [Candidatus Lokiarchaeum ossiferum]|uniref:Segregation and condensation protein B n=1 Tax=Candidatus Lokiarchaeum ossiferum TaxID=2951803 RepID=A0ABY6HSV8_9ARCH|nr:Segregation and condensation protein B [Candidatus Lokiarchaeum sp. B-35]